MLKKESETAVSCTEIYVERKNGDVEHYGDAHNAWGGAMHIWMTLKEHYAISGRDLFGGFEALWSRIQEYAPMDQWVLASTFDGMIIPVETLGIFLGHLKNFIKAHPTDTLKEELSILTRALSDTEVVGVCFNQTSVNSNPWYVYNSEEDEGRPYNTQQDSDHQRLTPDYFTTSENT